MSKKFLADIIQDGSGLKSVASRQLALHIIKVIKTAIIENGRFTISGFGAFTLHETARRKRGKAD
jgi:DNA-binding protein HU-beta